MENSLEQKFQEYQACTNNCDAAYEQYCKLDDEQTKLSEEFVRMALRKYLPVEKLKELLPWLSKEDATTWDHNQFIYVKYGITEGFNTTIRFICNIHVITPSTGPELYIQVTDNDEVKINLMDSEDVVNDSIAHYMQIINEARDEFLNEVKSVFNL